MRRKRRALECGIKKGDSKAEQGRVSTEAGRTWRTRTWRGMASWQRLSSPLCEPASALARGADSLRERLECSPSPRGASSSSPPSTCSLFEEKTRREGNSKMCPHSFSRMHVRVLECSPKTSSRNASPQGSSTARQGSKKKTASFAKEARRTLRSSLPRLLHGSSGKSSAPSRTFSPFWK